MKDPVKDKLKRFGLFSKLGDHRFFATVGEAVTRYLASQSVVWVDWEDRVGGGANDTEQKARSPGLIGPSKQAQ
jgi:hypothetical protein